MNTAVAADITSKLIALPKLAKGELWAGAIIAPDFTVRHTILLPAKMKVLDFDKGNDWAKAEGGSLPERIEQSLLRLHLPDEFEPRAYWSCEQSAYDTYWAWCQSFYYGDQYMGAHASHRT